MPSPIIQATIQATLLSAASNIFAQVITAYRKETLLSLKIIPILQFVVLSIFNTPINFLWQEWLEERFPTSTPSDYTNGPPLAASGEAGYYEKPSAGLVKDKAEEKKQTLNVRNILMKFLLDQTVGAVYNTVSFIVGMGVLKGQGGPAVIEAVRKDSFPLYTAGIKLWPLVSLLSFAVIPVERRVLFGNLVGVLWGIFLSLKAGGS